MAGVVPTTNNSATPMSWVIILSFLGFALLAFLLLYPVYRFLKKEEARNKDDQI